VKSAVLAVFGLALTLASGSSAVRLGWPERSISRAARPLVGVLSIGLGLAISSGVNFVWLLLDARHSMGWLIAADAGVAATLLVAALRKRGVTASLPPPSDGAFPVWLSRSLRIAALAAVGLSAFYAGLAIWAAPHGNWDAWAIWNVRARFLFRGVDHWWDAFADTTSHADYPNCLSRFFLPITVARFWQYAGVETTLVPQLIAFAFVFLVAALLFSALRLLRSETSTWLAVLSLFAMPLFVRIGTWQYSDVPIAFFFLAASALIAIASRGGVGSRRLFFLAGLAVGSAAWTKHEGILFGVAAAVSIFAVGETGRARTERVLAFSLGLAPFLVFSFALQCTLGHGFDLAGSKGAAAVLQNLVDPARHRLIWEAVWRRIVWLPSHAILFVLVPYAWATGRDRSPDAKPGIRRLALTLLLVLLGEYAVYIVTPHDLAWHLSTSIERLFTQLWPSFLLLFFVATGDLRFNSGTSRGAEPFIA
jgi:hypothetical protein